MSDLHAILSRLKSLDIRLSLDGERLNVNAPKGTLTPELRADLSAHKDAIKAHLRSVMSAHDAEPGIMPITPIPRTPLMPVSHTQQRLWFLKKMEPQSSAYNIPSATWVRGRLDVPVFERCFNELIARHESLRTRFVEVDGSPHTVIEPEARIELVRFDLSSVPPARREAEVTRLVIEFSQQPFDIGVAPLLRVALVRLAPELHLFCFVLDHIVADGISLGILGLDFHALYTAHATGSAAASSASHGAVRRLCGMGSALARGGNARAAARLLEEGARWVAPGAPVADRSSATALADPQRRATCSDARARAWLRA